MTTNAIDKRKKVIASDSRWSIPAGSVLYYVDDTGFDKIADRYNASIICAGDALLIDQWRNWFLAPRLNLAAQPPVERDTGAGTVPIIMSFLEKPSFRVVFSKGWYTQAGDDAFFCGSGGNFARDCYSKNGCGKLAVETAGKSDPATGGETKFVEFETNRHNLSTKLSSYDDAFEQLKSRGMVMDLGTGKVTPIHQLQATSGNALRAVLGGELSLSAPTGHAIQPWSEDEKAELRRALTHLASLDDADAANND